MAVITLTLTAAQSAALTYAAQVGKMSDADFGARLLGQALITYEQGLAATQTEAALKLKAAFDASKSTDTKAVILAKVATAEPVEGEAGEVNK